MTNSIPLAMHPCWIRLVSGGLTGFRTRQLGLQLMLKRLQGESISASQKGREVHAFFVKYERILAPEISQLAYL